MLPPDFKTMELIYPPLKEDKFSQNAKCLSDTIEKFIAAHKNIEVLDIRYSFHFLSRMSVNPLSREVMPMDIPVSAALIIYCETGKVKKKGEKP